MKSLSIIAAALLAGSAFAQQTPPLIPFDTNADFLKLRGDMNFGEVLGIAVNSRGYIVVLNHPGSANSAPLYGNSSTQIASAGSGRAAHERGAADDEAGAACRPPSADGSAACGPWSATRLNAASRKAALLAVITLTCRSTSDFHLCPNHCPGEPGFVTAGPGGNPQ